MNTRVPIIVVLLTTYAAATSRGETPVSGNSPLQLLHLDAFVVKHLEKHNIPGATVAITTDGKLRYSRAFGYANQAKKIPMKITHRSRVGSGPSKMLTVTSIFKLDEQKSSFSLDTNVYGFSHLKGQVAYKSIPLLPDVFAANGLLDHVDYTEAMYQGTRDNPAEFYWYPTMKVRHLVSHTAGFIKSGGDEETYRQVHLAVLNNNRLKFKPGTDDAYSNHGVGLSGFLIECVSGEDYYSYVKNNILSPIGLTHVVPTGVNKNDRDCAIHCYGDEDQKTIITEEVVERSGAGPGTPAGGWSFCAKDLARFMCAIDGLASPPDVLSANSVKTMKSRPYPNVAPTKAHGWQVSSNGKFSHNGTIEGGYSLMYHFPSDYVSESGGNLKQMNIAICFNIQNGKGITSLADKLANECAKAHLPPELDLF